LHSGALISVVREAGQSADTLVAANFRKMWARLWAPSRTNALWLVNQDVDSQLYTIDWSTVGNVFKPGEDDGYSRLFGRPVIPVEYCPTLGSKGDVILIDPSQYVLLDAGDVQRKVSAEVRFLESELAFLFTWELAGLPGWRQPLTPKNSSTTVSPFVALGELA
jgi:HK97 family phage major capsid protein